MKFQKYGVDDYMNWRFTPKHKCLGAGCYSNYDWAADARQKHGERLKARAEANRPWLS